MKKRKGFSCFYSTEVVRAYSKLTWLEEVNRFCSIALRGPTRKIWEDFSGGARFRASNIMIVIPARLKAGISC